MTLSQENAEVIKYEVRGTKYEVFELGATKLRRGVGRRQRRNHARGINQSTREDDTSAVCEAMKRCLRGIIAHHTKHVRFRSQCPNTPSRTFFPYDSIAHHTRHSTALPLRT